MPYAIVIGTVLPNGGDRALFEAQVEAIRAVDPSIVVEVTDLHPAAATALTTATVHPSLARTDGRRDRRMRLQLAARMVFATCLAMWCRVGNLPRGLRQRSLTARTVHAIASANVAFTPGGTMIVAHRPNLPRLLELVVAIASGQRLIHYTQTVTLPSSRIERRVARFVFRRAVAVFVRGEESAAAVMDLGAQPTCVHPGPDPALFLTRPEGVRRSCDSVVISVRRWDRGEREGETAVARYRKTIASITRELVDKGFHVTFESTCQGLPGYPIDDSVEADHIICSAGLSGDEQVLLVRSSRSICELLRDFGAASLVIATRMHAGLLAVVAGTPVLTIEYEPKALEAFSALNLGDWVIPYEHVETLLPAAVRDAIEHPTERLRRLESATASLEQWREQHIVLLERAIIDAHRRGR